MAEVQGKENRESDPTALAAEATATGGGKPRKPRATDGGPEILPDMGHYVTLVRKIKHRALVAQWLQHLHPEELPGIEWEHKVCTRYKQSLFTVVAGLCPVPSVSGWRKPRSASCCCRMTLGARPSSRC